MAVDAAGGTAAADSTPGPRAGLARRLGAVAYEALLLAAIALLVEFALLPMVTPGAISPSASGRLRVPAAPARWLSFACLFVLCGAYFSWSWSNGRKTLSMKTWRIGLQTVGGSPVGVRAAVMRYVACWIGPALTVAVFTVLERWGLGRWAIAFLIVNFAWALVDPDRQFLHDRIARTRLVLDSRPSASAVRPPD